MELVEIIFGGNFFKPCVLDFTPKMTRVILNPLFNESSRMCKYLIPCIERTYSIFWGLLSALVAGIGLSTLYCTYVSALKLHARTVYCTARIQNEVRETKLL